MRSPKPFSVEFPNFAYFFREVTTRHAERVALRYRARGSGAAASGAATGGRDFAEWSYARLGREGAALVAFLEDKGIGLGDRVAIWSENRPEWGVAYFALVAAGLVAVPVDSLLSVEEVGRVLAAAEAAAILVSDKFAEELPGVLASLSPTQAPVRAIVCFDEPPHPSAGSQPTMMAWSAALASGDATGAASARAMPDPASIPPDSLASLIFTSGTTGRPKAVMLSHAGIIANISAACLALPIAKEDVFMCVLPLHHTYPTTCSLLSPLAVGSSITICEKVVGKVIVDDVRDSGGTVMIAVPLLYDKLAQALEQGIAAKGAVVRTIAGTMRGLARLGLGLPGVGRLLFGSLRRASGLASLRLMVAGGGPLGAATARIFDELGFTIVQGYGMSENGPLISTNRPERHDHRSAGIAVDRTEIRVARIGGDGIGELQVRSPSLMKGYWRDPEATASIFTADGWLRTGDLGRIDDRGFIYITGRSKSIIVTAGGKNIYPEEIECRFEGSRVVREVLVLGKTRTAGAAEAVAAEEVAAVVVPDFETIALDHGAERAADTGFVRSLVKDEVERVNRSLPPYKKVSDLFVRSAEFEKTSSRKIKRYLYRTWSEATR